MAVRLTLLLSALMAALLAGAAGAADWADQRLSGPFVCRADFRLDEYDTLFVELAQLQVDLSLALDVEQAREPVELYLFQTEYNYRTFLQARLPQVPYRRALFVKGRGPGKVFAYKSKALPVDVRHEGTHGLLHAALPMVPLWLDEGLAEYFEVPAANRAYGNAYLKWVRAEAASPIDRIPQLDVPVGRLQKLAQLEAKRDISEMNATDYRHAWAWTHFLLHGPPEAHDELVKFLADIRNSTPPGQLSVRLERRLPGLDKRLAQHFRTWKK
ncbi:MAG TPA: DUF1570 domain-containing protein [Pirellulales bacterium]|nr:DUF1570 domain-containing protein [Pirellulales bacterium]